MFRTLSVMALLFVVSVANAEWKHESELGVVIASGNTTSRTENAKHKSEVVWSKNTVKLNGQYVHSLTEDADSKSDVEFWNLGGRYERAIADHFSLFGGNSWDGNLDAGYEYKTNFDFGGKYSFYKDKKGYLNSELGYRFTYQQNIEGTDPALVRSHFLRLFMEWGKKYSESVDLKFWVEVLPDLSDGDNLEINFEPSLKVVLTSLLSLKIAYLVKFDNVPAVAGNERFDTLYTTTLVASY